MFGESDPRNDYAPFGYLGRIPLYVTTLLVITYVAFMVAIALLTTGDVAGLPDLLLFDTGLVREHWQLWRFFSYPVVNEPSLWFAVEMYLLYSFGREVERFIGRTTFAVLYLSLVLLGPCLLTAAGPWRLSEMAGSGTANFAVFIAFCTIYPNVEIFFTFKAKWIAAVILGINTLIYLEHHAIIELVVFLATSLGAFLFIKFLRGQIESPFRVLREHFRQRRSRRALRPLPRPAAPPRGKPPTPRDDVIESIDPLLDKIATHGIGSLTPRERERLEAAREELLKKPSN